MNKAKTIRLSEKVELLTLWRSSLSSIGRCYAHPFQRQKYKSGQVYRAGRTSPAIGR